MRLTSRWSRAPRLPTVMDRAASIHMRMGQRCCIEGKVVKVMRRRTAKAAALGAVDMRPTTGEGAPWYTSGVQTWKGAAETLKPRPMMMRARAVKASLGVAVVARPWAIAKMDVDPVAP